MFARTIPIGYNFSLGSEFETIEKTKVRATKVRGGRDRYDDR
jgi:hypothetical protein